MLRKDIVSNLVLFAAVVSLVSLVLPSIVPTSRTETTTITGVLVVFPGYTSTITNNSTLFHKVAMTNTVTVISELTYTEFKRTPIYAAFGLGIMQFALLVILIILLGLSGIVLSRRVFSQ